MKIGSRRGRIWRCFGGFLCYNHVTLNEPMPQNGPFYDPPRSSADQPHPCRIELVKAPEAAPMTLNYRCLYSLNASNPHCRTRAGDWEIPHLQTP
jgi:hypothetical protein